MFVFEPGTDTWPARMCYYEDDRRQSLKGEIDLATASTVEPLSAAAVAKLGLGKMDPTFAFEIVTKERTWHLVASTKDELDGWLCTLRRGLRVKSIDR